MSETASGTQAAGRPQAPEPAPPAWFDVRADIAARVLSGSGIEIGGLHYPLVVPEGVHVTYVDRMSLVELRHRYPELAHKALVPVDVVDDGERLSSFEDSSLDFVVANHFLEHCHDPISTIGTHLRKIKPGGALFYAVPDKRFTFDAGRAATPLEHMIRDHEEGPAWSRGQHFVDWARNVYDDPDEPLRSEATIVWMAQALDDEDYSIHTHVFTQREIIELMLECRRRFENSFDIEVMWRRSIELITVLRKAGPVPPPAGWAAQQRAQRAVKLDDAPRASQGVRRPEPARSGPSRIADESPVRPPTDRGHPQADDERAMIGLDQVVVPLSSLPADLERSGSIDARWLPSVTVAERALPALRVGESGSVCYRLLLADGSRFTAHVATAPESAAGALSGAESAAGAPVAVAVSAELGDGSLIGHWSAPIDAGTPGWVQCSVDFALDETAEVALKLSAWTMDGQPSPSLWGDPQVYVPYSSLPKLGDASPSPSAGDATRQDERRGRSSELRSPAISVLMPVHDPNPRFLEEAIGSVRSQRFQDWQLCLADDGSEDPVVRAILDRHVAEDPRVNLTRLDPGQGISGATNAALALATGEYVALVDHDDLIREDALALIASRIAQDPTLEMVYSDEDRLSSDGREHSHIFHKPDWSPDLFRSAMYTCHLGVYRRQLLIELGGFRPEFDGSQEYDLVLRLMERTDRIGHVPELLYSWRIHDASAASSMDVKPYAVVAAQKAISEHIARTGVSATVETGPVPGWYRTRYDVDPWTSVAIIVPILQAPSSITDLRAIVDCVSTWELDAHHGLEVYFTGAAAFLRAYASALSGAGMDTGRIRFCAIDEPQSVGTIINVTASGIDNEYLALWPGPLKAASPGWFEQLVGTASRQDVGVAGGYITTRTGRAQAGALVFGDGWPLRVAYGGDGRLFPALVVNVRALNGAIVMRRQVFEAVGGLDVTTGDLAVVDVCLRAGALGLRSVLCSEVLFEGRELIPPLVSDVPLLASFRERWKWLGEDPYYNPNFWHGTGEFLPKPG